MADVVKYRFVLRRGLAADWTAKNEILLQGEFGLELDTDRVKIGDGTTAWVSLDYFDPTIKEGVNRQTGTSYAFVLTDVSQSILLSNVAPIALTIPTNASVPFKIGTKIAYTQGDIGVITVAGASGVTVHAPNGLVTGGAFDGCVAEKIGTNEWQIWSGANLGALATALDAPSDGQQYARTNAGWAVVTAVPVAGAVSAMNEQTGTTYGFVLLDATKGVRCTNASAITATIPTNASIALPLYTCIPVFQGGAGVVTIAGASGVTIESPNGVVTAGIGDFRTIFQRAANIWVIG